MGVERRARTVEDVLHGLTMQEIHILGQYNLSVIGGSCTRPNGQHA